MAFDQDAVARAAAAAGFGPAELHAALPSSNDRLLELADAGAGSGTLVVTLEQTAGRGRAGRGFASPRGGLYLSLLLRLPGATLARYPLSLVVGLALSEALDELAAPTALKWPNDVLVGEKKVAGILVEAKSGGRETRVVVGVGINVETPPAALPPEALSLIETAGAPDRAQVLTAFLAQLRLRLEQLQRGELEPLRAAVGARSALLGERVRAEVRGRPVEGRAVGLAPSGALLLRTDAGETLELLSGDVRRLRGSGA
ncbi:MAG: biotin--[acetyl-CoA-carboxylase] ligase [Planctomycetota bacterium]